MEDDELLAQAIKAYTRNPANDQPCVALSNIYEHDGTTWVILRNVKGRLAVYRFNETTGHLRRSRLGGDALESSITRSADFHEMSPKEPA